MQVVLSSGFWLHFSLCAECQGGMLVGDAGERRMNGDGWGRAGNVPSQTSLHPCPNEAPPITLPSHLILRVVGSSVANSLSSASTPALVSRFSSVDLPAVVVKFEVSVFLAAGAHRSPEPALRRAM